MKDDEAGHAIAARARRRDAAAGAGALGDARSPRRVMTTTAHYI